LQPAPPPAARRRARRVLFLGRHRGQAPDDGDAGEGEHGRPRFPALFARLRDLQRRPAHPHGARGVEGRGQARGSRDAVDGHAEGGERKVSRPAPRALALIPLLLAAGGCTLAGPRTAVDQDGYQQTTYYECDWKQDGRWLHPGVPNSPILPATRVNPLGFVVGVVPFMFDVAFSPIAFSFDRNCWVTGQSDRVYVGTPEVQRQQKLAQEKADREAQAAREAEERANTVAARK